MTKPLVIYFQESATARGTGLSYLLEISV